MYKKVSTDLNFTARELETIEFWQKNSVFERSSEKNKGNAEFTFYDGPPTANGKPHIGHIFNAVHQRPYSPGIRPCRGYNVLRIAGWDTHGLPVELEVERALGLGWKRTDRMLRCGAFYRAV